MTRSHDTTPARARAVALCALLGLTVAGAGAARIWTRDTGAGASGTGGTADAGLHFVAPGAGPVHLEGRLDRGAVLRGEDGLVRLELLLRGDRGPVDAGAEPRMPTDLVVVLDRSGSMSGEPLAFARAAVHELVSQLGESDRFALVSYASTARLEIPLTSVSAGARAGFADAVDALRARGGTNMSSGLELATTALVRARADGRALRVVLLSDGHANEGDSSFEGLRRRAARAVQGEWVLSAVGVGAGFDEALMSALADAGTGNFYYLRDGRGLGEVFRGEFAAARDTLARALSVRVEPGAGVELLDAAGYPLERDGSVVRFRPGALFAGQERRVWLSFQVPTDGPADTRLDLARIALVFDRGGERRELAFAEPPRVRITERPAEFLAAVDPAAWEQGVVVDEYNALKASVARAIRSGEPERARKDIDAYVARNESLGRALASEVVQQQLEEVVELGDELDAAFAAPASEAPARQNDLSKKLVAEGRDGRRPGAKK